MAWLRELGSNPWLALAANVAQVASVAIVVALWRWHVCRVPWCYRPGQHKVGRTSWKVCSRHYTPVQHERLTAEHARRHPDRIGGT